MGNSDMLSASTGHPNFTYHHGALCPTVDVKEVGADGSTAADSLFEYNGESRDFV